MVDREAAEITAIIAIEVRTGRCLLNPIGNRREVEHDLLPRFRVPILRGREGGQTRRASFTPKDGRTAPFNPRVNGAYPAKRCNHDLRSHVSRSPVQSDFTQSYSLSGEYYKIIKNDIVCEKTVNSTSSGEQIISTVNDLV